MMEDATQLLGIGRDPGELGFLQISLRALVVFVAAIVMVRMGDKRFMARTTAFDVIMAFMLASILARAVNGSAPLFPSLGAGFVLVWIHRLLGFVARHWHWFGSLVKGHSDVLIENGKLIPAAMRKNNLSEQDVMEELRLHGKTDSMTGIRRATVERSGHISVVSASEDSSRERR